MDFTVTFDPAHVSVQSIMRSARSRIGKTGAEVLETGHLQGQRLGWVLANGERPDDPFQTCFDMELPDGRGRPLHGDADLLEIESKRLYLAEAFTALITDGPVWFDTHSTVVWDGDGCVVKDATQAFTQMVQLGVEECQSSFIDGCAYSLGDCNAINYHHWMNGVLRHGKVFRASGLDLDKAAKFVDTPLRHQLYLLKRRQISRFPSITCTRRESTSTPAVMCC